MPSTFKPKIANHENPISVDRVEVPVPQETTSTSFAIAKMRSIWRYVASMLLTLGWFIPLLLIVVTIIADAWDLEVLEQDQRIQWRHRGIAIHIKVGVAAERKLQWL